MSVNYSLHYSIKLPNFIRKMIQISIHLCEDEKVNTIMAIW